MSNQVGIYAAMAAILAEFPAIGKDKKNQQQGFKYRGIDEFMNAAHSLMAKHGVFLLPCVKTAEFDTLQTKSGSNQYRSRVTVIFKFVHRDGSSVECESIGTGMDLQDKDTSKAVAMALKYAISQVFMVPYEMHDADAATPDETVSEDPAARAAKEWLSHCGGHLQTALEQAKQRRDGGKTDEAVNKWQKIMDKLEKMQ